MTRPQAIDGERLRRISKEGAWVALGQVAAVLGALVGVRLLTELLDPTGYGQLALAMTLAILLHQTVYGPLSNGMTRFWSTARESQAISDYLIAVRGLLVTATLLVGLLALAAAVSLVLLGQEVWALLAVLAALFAVLRGFNTSLGGMQNAERQRIVVALHQGAEAWLRFLIAAAIIVSTQAVSTAALAGYVLALLLVLISQVVVFVRRVRTITDIQTRSRDWRGDIWQFSWPFAAFGLFTWAQVASARWALERFADTGDVGYYAVLFQLGVYPMLILTAMVIQFLAPVFYQRAGDAHDAARIDGVLILGTRLTAITVVLTVIATVAALLLHELIFRVLVAVEYRSVSHLLPWLVFAGGLSAAGQTIELRIMSMLASRSLITAKVATAIAGVILNFVGAWKYGTPGVVVANVLFAIPYFIWMSVLAKRASRGKG